MKKKRQTKNQTVYERHNIHTRQQRRYVAREKRKTKKEMDSKKKKEKEDIKKKSYRDYMPEKHKTQGKSKE